MKKKLLFSLFLIAGIGFGQAQDLPANPDPGKCWVKCITKDTFKEVTETIEVYPAYTKLRVVPATYRTVEETVLVKEATKKFIYVPATYKTESVAYVKKEGRTDLTINPATFGSDSRTFETYPVTSGWEYKVLDDCPSANKEGCVTACFVEYPAQFKDVPFTTLANDASTNNVPVAEQPTSYTKRVIDTPARVDEIEIPAEYATIKRQVVDTPASKRVIDETLLPILNDKPVNIEIMSHTDSRGNDDYNMSLSQQRANSVVNYLVGKGISRSRLTARGYGETRLTNRCANGVECAESQHQKNRRTEFRVLGNN